MNRLSLRPDLEIISDWIRPHSRVLDLGCGDGTLLAQLMASRDVRGYGLEIDGDEVIQAMARGVNVIQADVDDGLKDFATDTFDYVVMTQTLQALARPDVALEEMLRVGHTCIVTFPNFGHWRVRAALAAGRMPRTAALPAQWYDTQNIHLCTVADFEALCAERGWRILRSLYLDRRFRPSWRTRIANSLLCEIAVYMLQD